MTVNHSSRGRLVLQSLFHRPFQCGWSRKLRLIVAACCWTLAAGPSAAAIYDPGPLVFETFGQSMWDSGNAAILSDSAFLGTSWDASIGPLGGIIGEERERVPGTGGSLTAPNPLHAVWRKCRDSIFKSVCGSEPSRTITVNNPIPAQFVDTRSGATLSAGTNGRVGLDLSAIHPELKGRMLGEFLPAQPLTKIIARHTVGLSDPLTAADLTPENRIADGLHVDLEPDMPAQEE